MSNEMAEHRKQPQRHTYISCDARLHIADLNRQLAMQKMDTDNWRLRHDQNEQRSREEIKKEFTEGLKGVITAVEGIRKQIIGLLITIVAAVVVAGVLSFFKP